MELYVYQERLFIKDVMRGRECSLKSDFLLNLARIGVQKKATNYYKTWKGGGGS